MAAQYRTGFAPKNRMMMGAPSVPTSWDTIARPSGQLAGVNTRPLMGTPGGGTPNPALAAIANGPAPGGIQGPQGRQPMVPPSVNPGAFALPPSMIPPMATPAPDTRPVLPASPTMGVGYRGRRGPTP